MTANDRAQTIGTDDECWLDDPARHVSVAAVFDLYAQSLVKARRLLGAMLSQPQVVVEPPIRAALASAMVTPPSAATPAQRLWLDVLLR